MTPKLSRVIRLDSIPLKQTHFTPEGYLSDRPILTTTGIFEYMNSDGSVRRELRLPEEVFAPESLATYKGKPVIITHDAGLITKDNVHQEQIGTILSEGYRSGNDVRAEIIIHDTDEMKDCGLKELSLGYNLDLDETPGVWEGQPYDAIQRNIRINHLALVREARAGETARLNIDSRDNKILKGGKSTMSKKTKKTARRADGVLSQEELAKAIEEYKARRASRAAAKTDEEAVEEVVAETTDTTTVDNGEVNEAGTVEEKMQLVKDRRDRRDSEGDPETTEEAIGVIANQDEDIDILFDIIDTLLAEKAFDEAEETKTETEETVETEAAATDEGEEEEETVATENTDEGEETEEVAEDEEEESTENLDEEEEETPVDTKIPAPKGEMNADSVDRIVRTRIQLGMVGRTLNMDGLENLDILAAKKKVIKAVRPGLRLDGKSETYINAAYDCAVDEIKKQGKKDTSYQKKQMFNNDSRTSTKTAKNSAASARQRMIDRHQK